ncbi:MAG: DUF814 domain-containing protein [Ignavibacteria bacterium]|nr:DUF814 domain-containing protein [Ignavibacteria bacterium]
MLNNYFILKETAEYLNKTVSGKRITEVYTQEKNKFVIEVTDNAENVTALEYSADKTYNYIIIRRNFSKAGKNYADLFPEIMNLKITGTGIYNDDRIIRFMLENNYELYFTFFAVKPNCFLLKDSEIISSFKDKSEFINKGLNDIIPSAAEGGKWDNENITIRDYIKYRYRKYGQIYADEALYRLNLTGNETACVNLKEIADKYFEQTDKNLLSPEYILYKKGNKFVLSLMQLNHLKDFEKIYSNNIAELCSDYLKSKKRFEKINNFKSQREKEIKGRLTSLEKKEEGLKIQLSHCLESETLRKYGEIITGNAHLIKKGDKHFLYEDSSQEIIKIGLRENLTPNENAQHYFEKYKKQKASVKLLEGKVKIIAKEKGKLKIELKELAEMDDIKKINREEKKSAEIKKDETSRFRKFVLNEKYEVWVGKDSASNDLLTTKYSAQNDLWFHVRGASGSHTVLKTGSKKELPPKEIIYKAAGIAAYYSKARNSSSVPVAYCERKYVKKKKGFREGSVIMEKEKVIFVKPSIPDGF